MQLQDFISDFAEQFDETDAAVFSAETRFRDLDEWSSLIGLAVLNMTEMKYGVRISPIDFRNIATIQELFDFTAAKR